jgi:type IV pilus assembly protein PilM
MSAPKGSNKSILKPTRWRHGAGKRKYENISEFTDVIADSGKDILSVNIAPVPLFNAAKATQIKDDECVLLLNIGNKSSSLIIGDHSRIFIRSIPIGGHAITLQIAKEFAIEADEAESLKQRYGFVALGGALCYNKQKAPGGKHTWIILIRLQSCFNKVIAAHKL